MGKRLTEEEAEENYAMKLLKMRQYRAQKTGAAIPRNFEKLELQKRQMRANDSSPVNPKLAIKYPVQIEPTQQKHDGIETIASVMGRKERVYILK